MVHFILIIGLLYLILSLYWSLTVHISLYTSPCLGIRLVVLILIISVKSISHDLIPLRLLLSQAAHVTSINVQCCKDQIHRGGNSLGYGVLINQTLEYKKETCIRITVHYVMYPMFQLTRKSYSVVVFKLELDVRPLCFSS